MFENGQLTVLNVRDILPNRFQPRIKFDEEKLEELAESINKYGVIQPIVVRPVGQKFEIIAGERRFKASRLASRSTIPAIIVNLSDKDSEEIALLENIQRQELSPIEEAVSYKRILDMGYITQEQLAKKIGKAQSTIANKIRLLNLDDEVQSYLLNNKISERHARSLLRITDKEKQVKMLHRIVTERLTVKQTDKEIAKLKEEENVVKPIELTVPVKTVMSSTNTNQNFSEEIESLFDDEDERGNNMDIDRIMREAKDINGNTVPETKDISNLMSPSGVNEQPLASSMPQPVEDSSLELNKFINVTPPEPTTEKEKPTENINNGVTFDSMFNQHIESNTNNANNISNTNNNMMTPPVMESNVVTSNVSLPESSVATNNQNENLGVNNLEVNNSTLQQQKPLNNIGDLNENIETSHLNSTVVSDSSMPTSQNTGIPEIDSDYEADFNKPNIYVSNEPASTITPETKKAISTAVATALKKYNEDKARKAIASTIPSPIAPISEGVSDIGIPDTNIIADDNLNEYVNPALASTITQDVKQVNNQAKFAEIVKMLRDCADKIEQNGYFVNVDELDLGNQYKVTFTINKE